MKIGIPKEIKDNENRVGMTPSGVAEFIKHGHRVYVQHTAGENSGFSDASYQAVGAEILPSIEDVYKAADMIVKVKEPIEPEYPLVRENQLLFTYFHFACDKPLTEAMIKSGAVCLAYETVQKGDRSLPLLIPMSEVAGRMGVMNGAYYLQKTKGGKGKLISGVPGVFLQRFSSWEVARSERLQPVWQQAWVLMSLSRISLCLDFGNWVWSFP